MKGLPAIPALPDRPKVELFCCHERMIDPGPDPLVAETFSHDPLPDADHPPPAQPLGEPLMFTTVDPAPADGLAELGLILKLVQVGGALPA